MHLKLPNNIKTNKLTKDIDLLEAYKLSKHKEDPKNKKILLFIFVEVIVILFIMTFMKISIYFRKNEVTFLEAEIDSYKTQTEEINRFNKIKNLYERKFEVYDEIVSKNQAILTFFKTMEDILPENTILESLVITDDGVSFLVSAASEELIAQLLNNMESSGYFLDISINGITTAEGQKKSSINTLVKGFKKVEKATDDEGGSK